MYLDTAEDDLYGLAANMDTRVSGLAQPGTVAVSDAVEPPTRGQGASFTYDTVRSYNRQTAPSPPGVSDDVSQH